MEHDSSGGCYCLSPLYLWRTTVTRGFVAIVFRGGMDIQKSVAADGDKSRILLGMDIWQSATVVAIVFMEHNGSFTVVFRSITEYNGDRGCPASHTKHGMSECRPSPSRLLALLVLHRPIPGLVAEVLHTPCNGLLLLV